VHDLGTTGVYSFDDANSFDDPVSVAAACASDAARRGLLACGTSTGFEGGRDDARVAKLNVV
jgi:hypothetical protein